MEAALWGCVKNVGILLAHGADKNLQDADGRSALSFTQTNRLNTKEWEKCDCLQVEDTCEAVWRRHEIAALLEGKELTRVNLAPTIRADRAYYKPPNENEVILLEPCARFQVGDSIKTLARLIRGSPFSDVNAMSGWDHEGDDPQCDIISGRKWTQQVRRICRLIGYELAAEEEKDQGVRGSYNASHAEKQLIAYFINRHIFLEDELESKKYVEQLKSDLHGDCEFQRMALDYIAKRSLEDFWKARPPLALGGATILVSSKICPDCLRFIREVEKNFNVRFDITVRSFQDGLFLP